MLEQAVVFALEAEWEVAVLEHVVARQGDIGGKGGKLCRSLSLSHRPQSPSLPSMLKIAHVPIGLLNTYD